MLKFLMKSFNRAKGNTGEQIAVHYLMEHGFSIVEQNFSCKLGEIDIIALRGNTFHFIEVKYRMTTNFGHGREAVTPTKQRTIHNVAMLYLQKKGLWGEVDISFDVIDILGSPTNYQLEFLEECF